MALSHVLSKERLSSPSLKRLLCPETTLRTIVQYLAFVSCQNLWSESLLSNSCHTSIITNWTIHISQLTETVLVSIKNEVHLSLAHGEPTAPVLDLSAAFDTIDHNILLGYLKSWFGLGGTALKWFASYLSDRSQNIKIGSTLSELSKLLYGIPQGSVLGPLLFSLNTTPLSKIIRLHPHIKFHFYADDTQLYIHLSHKNASVAFAKLNACLHDVQR